MTDFGNLSVHDSGTGNLGCKHDRVALYFDSKPMVLARFPNVEADGSWNFSLARQPIPQGKCLPGSWLQHRR